MCMSSQQFLDMPVPKFFYENSGPLQLAKKADKGNNNIPTPTPPPPPPPPDTFSNGRFIPTRSSGLIRPNGSLRTNAIAKLRLAPPTAP